MSISIANGWVKAASKPNGQCADYYPLDYQDHMVLTRMALWESPVPGIHLPGTRYRIGNTRTSQVPNVRFEKRKETQNPIKNMQDQRTPAVHPLALIQPPPPGRAFQGPSRYQPSRRPIILPPATQPIDIQPAHLPAVQEAGGRRKRKGS